MTSTASACPVVPELTCSYVGDGTRPPAYPDIADVTPRTCSNTPSTPQKQPPANTAVSSDDTVASGTSAAGAGSATASPRRPTPGLVASSKAAAATIENATAPPGNERFM